MTATPDSRLAQIIEKCPTECTYDDDFVRFTVRCSLDAGHLGRHRGQATIEFAPPWPPVWDPQ